MNSPIAPAQLHRYAGKIVDVDSHEMIPWQRWEAHFGPEVKELAEFWLAHGLSDQNDKNHPSAPGYAGDVSPISAKVLDQKGCRAPGAEDVTRRLDVMKAMGGVASVDVSDQRGHLERDTDDERQVRSRHAQRDQGRPDR